MSSSSRKRKLAALTVLLMCSFAHAFRPLHQAQAFSKPVRHAVRSVPAHGRMSMVSPLFQKASLALAAEGSDLLLVQKNVFGDVLGELNNLRTPAALIGAAALGTIFVTFPNETRK
jgi:hypothetical protein